MQAIQLNSFGLDGLALTERPTPEPGPGEVRLKVKASCLNFHDLVTVLGKANPKLAMPLVPLSDGAGVIDAVGEGVTRVAVGERAMSTFYPHWVSGEPTPRALRRVTGETADGCLADHVILPEEGVVKTPSYLSDVEAATLPCAALTAWRAVVVEGKVKAGDTVLVQGTGGVSLFALQFAKLQGAQVIATSSSDDKLQRAQQLGADHLINYREQPQWARQAQALTGRRGVDLVVEVGGAGTLDQSLRAIRMGGHISMIGVLSGWADTVSTARIMVLNAVVKGITVANRDDFQAMCRAMQQHELRPVVGETHPFLQASEALARMQSGGHFGKICLTHA